MTAPPRCFAAMASSTTATARPPRSTPARDPAQPPGYDGFCRDRGLERGPTTALRFRTPREGVTVGARSRARRRRIRKRAHRRLRGGRVRPARCSTRSRTSRTTATTGSPTSFAARSIWPTRPSRCCCGRRSISDSTTSWRFPRYAHLPLLVNEQRKKLSKRKDPVATEMYRDEGYLSAAFVNYLALLGWSPRGDEEIVPLSTLDRAVPPRGRLALAGVL